MIEKQYSKGDYTNCIYDICEILKDDEVYCIVGTEYADKIIEVLEENERLKEKNERLLAKLKFTLEQINYSERLREMIK